jgi:hypothetical protein
VGSKEDRQNRISQGGLPPDSVRYDLLQTDLFLELLKRPFLLREQLLAAAAKQLKGPVIIDEVQKVPQLLDEIHWLIENRGLRGRVPARPVRYGCEETQGMGRDILTPLRRRSRDTEWEQRDTGNERVTRQHESTNN